ncbi:MAG: MFS transporter [Bowdeniella nasicola]|nr:MFS transporter [Bowdeniella nasicola]
MMTTRETSSDWGALRTAVPTPRQRATDEPQHRDIPASVIPASAAELSADAASRDRSLPLATRLRAYVSSIDPRRVDGPRTPLIVFGLTGVLSAWSTAALSIAGPEIQADFGTSVAALTSIAAIAGVAVVVLGLPLGWLVDRVSRVRLVQFSAVVGPIGTVIQALARTFGTFTMGNVVTQLATIPSQIASGPLLADYFPARSRARAYGIIGAAGSFGALIATPVTGLLVKHYGWRSTTLALTSIAVITAALTFILREPQRGAMDRADLGVQNADEPVAEHPPTFSEALRAAWSIKTMRLQAIAGFVSMFSLPLNILLGLLMASKFALGPLERSLLATATSLLAIPALLIGTGIADRLLRYKPATLVALQAGLQFVSAAGIIAQAFAPNLVLFFIASTIPSVLAIVLSPIGFTVSSMIVPARIRGAGMQIFTPFSLLGLAFTPVLLLAAEGLSLEMAFVLFAPFMVISGLIYLASAGSVAGDIRAARAAAVAEDVSLRSRGEAATKLLVARDIEVARGSVTILSSVDLDVRTGEVLALCGTNGSGKSTLLRALCGLANPTNGAVFYRDRDITHLPAHELVRRGVVYVPGGDGILPHLSVHDHLRLALDQGRSHQRTAVVSSIAEVCEFFPPLAKHLHTQAGNLSGGEQQMLAIALGMSLRPTLLLIDEFSLGLAPAVVDRLIGAVTALRRAGVTLVIVEQSLNIAQQLTDRVVYLDAGEKVHDGTMAELFNRPELIRPVLLARSNKARTFGRTREQTPALVVRDLCANRAGIPVLTDVNFQVMAHEIVGIIGANGAGKTTLFDAISGFLPTTGGQVCVAGSDITHLDAAKRATNGLARAFQNARLFDTLSVGETISVASSQAAGHPVSSYLLATAQSRAHARRTADQVDALMAALGLEKYRDHRLAQLSTGTRRAVELACQMATNPKMVLLDEPSSGLAQAEVESLGPTLGRITAQSGCGMLLIEHDLPLLTRICTRLIALERGRVLTSGPVDEVLAHPQVRGSYLAATTTTVHRSGTAMDAKKKDVS